MKFFSNEKENEAQYADDDPERTQHVASEPVTVPPQRAGSPWSDRPGDAPAAVPADTSPHTDSDPERRDGTTYGPDGTVVTERADSHPDDVDIRLDDEDTRAAGTGHDVHEGVAPADADKPAEQTAVQDDGTFDSPTAVEPATGEPIRPEAQDAIKDDGTFESPAVVEPATGKPVERSGAATSDRLLPDGDAFTERFRDIQLRFVDDPKDATAEASRLVEEVVDKLTSTLKAQRDALGGNADDTEKLRVELRGYRDILNRLLSL
ncbi:hypothetical protein Ade02nite_22920 [Paractinoplanes deccanensis]|uniref:Uncharacterized protein n=1 Tax=Paractinoplanes deccanensis TaxID=113561 RepID=A0ABQ3Y0X0_9ACTN|nr:hypothetical protein [Actinoplanes deccanensis]GID73651.1 hypothetical protein Ade02nite_22920 [Actinoplanes deccanensis]